MAASDAKALEVKGEAFRYTFTIYQSDGVTPLTGAAGLDAQLIKDAGAAAAATNDPVEESLGVYHLDLTASEMNADTVVVVPSTSTTGALVPRRTLYPSPTGWNEVATTSVPGRPISVDVSGAVNANATSSGSSDTSGLTNLRVDEVVYTGQVDADKSTVVNRLKASVGWAFDGPTDTLTWETWDQTTYPRDLDDPPTGYPTIVETGAASWRWDSQWVDEAQQLMHKVESGEDALALISGTAPELPPSALIVLVSPDTDQATVTWDVAGGPSTEFDLVEVSPGSEHGVSDLPGTQRSVTIPGLTSNTDYRFRLVASGPGGTSNPPAEFIFRTLPLTAAPASISLVASFPTARGDNSGSITLNKPTGAVAGDTEFVVFSRDTGALSTIVPAAGFSEATYLAVGAVNGVATVRVFYRTLTSGDSAVTSRVWGSDGNDSSTVVEAFAVTGAPVSISSSAKTGNLGTSTSIVAPSVTGVDGGILVTGHFYVPSPNPTTGRTFTPPSGMTERADVGTVAGYWYAELSTLALSAGGATGTKTATASGALTASYAITFVVAPSGGDPSITSPTLTVGAHPSDATLARISGTVTGNFDQIVGDGIGDGQPPTAPFVGANSVSFVLDVAKQPSAFQMSIDLTPTLGTRGGGVVRVGPYTIPALAGGGTLPAKTQTVASLILADNTTYRDQYRIAPVGWDLNNGAQAAVTGTNTQTRTRATINLAPHLYNITADGNPNASAFPGGMALYLNAGYVEDFTCKNWGAGFFGAFGYTSTNPNNAHAAYIRNTIAYRLLIEESSYRWTGPNSSYDLHNRMGSGEHFIELHEFESRSSAPGGIGFGGGQIVDSYVDGFIKLLGTFYIGGLSPSTHRRLVVRGMHVNALVIRGNWLDRLEFIDCSYKSLVTDGLAGSVIGVNQPGGLLHA